ncbi:hypothetical protein QAD02_022148, partial [Eretmocerus hayati]
INSISRSSVKLCGRRRNITSANSVSVKLKSDKGSIKGSFHRKNFVRTQNFSMVSKDYLPYCASGKVVSGFGRGSKSLGCPTANFPDDVVQALPNEFETGIYYGWASLDNVIYKMVMSIGWNPFYKNDKKSMEIHLLHKFENDFYGEELKIIATGYVRPEMNFSSVEELIEAINNDIKTAHEALDHPDMIKYKEKLMT